ncbi:response regulator [Desulfovibrio inopinatus]|uniref:response regulator n=1 Tax=Desulfovibrio inopinatus TaxID=102109 RepID=UPI0003F54CAD|nr:response regulator [Desulfovibrio inopinatus]
MDTIRVLIVEDDERIADLHRRFTERVDGCEVVGVSHDLESAWDMIEILEPDLVLLDIYFPDGDGLSLLRNIRAKGLETDVILITAAREVATLKEALRGGVFDYIIKPVIMKRFQECLGQFRTYRQRLRQCDNIEQQDVDTIFHSKSTAGRTVPRDDLPKGVDRLTLDKVRAVVDAPEAEHGLSAEAVGTSIGVSRSTARRYLEYLVSVGVVVADLVYGTVGRPERKYFRVR